MMMSKDQPLHIEVGQSGVDAARNASVTSSIEIVKTRAQVICQPHHLGKLIYVDPADHELPYTEHGVAISPEEKDVLPAHPNLTWSKIRHLLREPFAEFWGVFILVMFGDGVVAQVVLSKGTKGDYQSISWGWGIGVMLGVYTAGVSGAHLNPAVTLTNCVLRQFPWRKFPTYLIAQFLGGLLASGVVYANYLSAIIAFEGGPNVRTVSGPTSTASIFCTYPAEFMTVTGMFFSEFIASTVLMFLIYSLKDDGNLGAGILTPLGLFFIIFGIGACFGWETGYALNLARDLGPRIMSWFLGYGTEVFVFNGTYYFWIPIVSPFCGCLFGGLLYDVFIFTGESPINTPWMGWMRVLRPERLTWSSCRAARAREQEHGLPA